MAIYDRVEILLGTVDASEINRVNELITYCQEEAVAYCNLAAYDASLDSAVVQMVVERYNRIGAEGVNSSSSNGISESYLDGYSAPVMSLLQSKRKLVSA
jgi:ribulose bisphosphate carboxylase small subunit